MKITFRKDILEASISDSLCAVSDKNTYPALEGIRFTAKAGEKCLITTYDLNKGFLTEIDCECEEGGNYIINAQRLYRIIKFSPDTYVTLEINRSNKVLVTSGAAKFELTALEGESFPNLPNLEGDDGFTVPSSVLKKMIGEIFFAIAVTDQRPMLCGAYFSIIGDKLKIVSCDGNRLAIREINGKITKKKEKAEALNLSFIIPGKTLAQLVRLLSDSEDEVSVHLGRKHAIFRYENKIFFTRLLDGEYIDYTRVIPKEPKIEVVVDRLAVISSLERASLITEEKMVGQVRSSVTCNFSGDTLKIYTNSVSGSVYDEVKMTKTGDDIIMGFNCRFMLEALKSAEGKNVKILITSALLSIIILPEEKEEDKSDFLYMVCPVKIN